MHLPEVLRPMLELTVIIPAAILAFLPMKGHLRVSERKLRTYGILGLLLWVIVGGTICDTLYMPSNNWLFPWMFVFLGFFCWVVQLPLWKSMSVFLAVCGVISCLTNLATLVDAMFVEENLDPWFAYPGIWAHLVLCWLLLGVLWYPATHAARWLLDEIEMPSTRYVFWILPSIFFALNMFIKPVDYDILHSGYMLSIYAAILLALLGLLLFCYFMFYLMARGIGRRMRLVQENEVLHMQAAQYRILQKNMEDTRRARHDLRQHFIALQGCIDSGDLQAVSDYVQSHMQMIPLDTPQFYCENFALNAVLHYYATWAAQEEIQMDITVRMERDTLIPEPELCTLLGNLLENALDACRALMQERTIQVQIQQNGPTILAILVKNTCPEPPQWKGDRLDSTKQNGLGFGTQSVRLIAEHYHGSARFTWENGVFQASVLLNP